jgi:hypothetical protein
MTTPRRWMRSGHRSTGTSTPREAGARRGLIAFPAQSNFSGVRHPLRLIDLAHSRGYDVLLDAAAYVPTRRLDLSAVHPDFVHRRGRWGRCDRCRAFAGPGFLPGAVSRRMNVPLGSL